MAQIENGDGGKDRRAGHTNTKKGLVIVNTGDGKGKTTAALGVLLRSWGRGMRVEMFQFLKHTGARFGEQRAADKLGIPIRSMGDGFTWLSKDMDRTRALAVEQWGHCAEAILGDVLDVLRRLPPMLHVVITGRSAPQELVDYADLVTEMRAFKHPYNDQGIRAQAGIEF
jgi:cob(I)alamin adenosyltransferase